MLLTAVTGGLLVLCTLVHLPAGAQLAAIAASAVVGRGLKISRWAFLGGQGIVGCIIGQSMTPGLFQAFLERWPLVCAIISSTVGISVALGWTLYKMGFVDKATALWGTLPGAASAMVVLSAAHGANTGLVAFIQYFRVLSVAVIAALAGGALGPGVTAHIAGPVPDPTFAGALVCVVIVLLLTFASTYVRVVGLSLLGGMVLAGAVQISGMTYVWLPSWVLTGAFCAIGWQIGLAITRETLKRAGQLLVPVFLSTVALLLLCGGIGFALSSLFEVSLLTAFLATIPGGLDAVAIIAVATGADVAFVMLFQTFRFLIVVIIGIPLLGRWLSVGHQARCTEKLS